MSLSCTLLEGVRSFPFDGALPICLLPCVALPIVLWKRLDCCSLRLSCDTFLLFTVGCVAVEESRPVAITVMLASSV